MAPRKTTAKVVDTQPDTTIPASDAPPVSTPTADGVQATAAPAGADTPAGTDTRGQDAPTQEAPTSPPDKASSAETSGGEPHVPQAARGGVGETSPAAAAGEGSIAEPPAFVVLSPVDHDGRRYEPGEPLSLTSRHQWAALHDAGCIAGGWPEG